MGGSRGNLSLDSKTNHPFTIKNNNKKKNNILSRLPSQLCFPIQILNLILPVQECRDQQLCLCSKLFTFSMNLENLNIWAININQLFMRISRNHHQLARSEFDETLFSKSHASWVSRQSIQSELVCICIQVRLSSLPSLHYHSQLPPPRLQPQHVSKQ